MCFQEATPRAFPGRGRALTHLGEVAGARAQLPSQERPGDPNDKSEGWALGPAWRPAQGPAGPHPHLSSCPHPLTAAAPVLGLRPSSLPPFPSLLLPQGPRRPHAVSSPPPAAEPLARGGGCYSQAEGSLGAGTPGP